MSGIGPISSYKYWKFATPEDWDADEEEHEEVAEGPDIGMDRSDELYERYLDER